MTKSRKFAALVIILLSFLSVAHAQDSEDGEDHGIYLPKKRIFYGGLVVGATFSQVDGDYYAGYHKVGLNVGGISYAQLGKHVALSMEILYDQKGSKSNGAQYSPAPATSLLVIKYGITANYAEIPLMINYFDRRRSHFGMGFSYSRLVNSSENIQTDTSFSTTTKSMDLSTKYPFKKSDFDFLAGVDLHLIKGLFLNIRFQYSMVPIRSGADLPPVAYARSNQYMNMWVVRLMYLAQ